MRVSIGIPTYQRLGTLRRSLASAQAQTYAPLEIVICDNASADGTEAFCRAAAAADPRVRYVRHARNIGPTANFNELFRRCTGDYVLMLADDDWIDPQYVEACVRVLRADARTVLVAGRPRYVREGQEVAAGVRHQHCQAGAAERVLDYLGSVRDNGVFYGVMPRRVLGGACPLPNALGNDWLHVARIAAQGAIMMIDEVEIHRELGGTSADVATILSTFGRSGWQARVPQLVIASEVLRDIGWRHPVYADLGRSHRLVTGLRGAVVSIAWPDLAWHLVTPAIAALGRRPRGRRLWRLYDRATRALGAGQAP